MPFILSIGNPDLKDRHWINLVKRLNIYINYKQSTLNDFLSLGLIEKIAIVEEISQKASGEAMIES